MYWILLVTSVTEVMILRRASATDSYGGSVIVSPARQPPGEQSRGYSKFQVRWFVVVVR